MDERQLKDRTLQFGLRIMRLVDALPQTSAGRAIGNQLVRSGTSVGANYRAACRGRSKLSSLQNWASLSKRQTNAAIGWS